MDLVSIESHGRVKYCNGIYFEKKEGLQLKEWRRKFSTFHVKKPQIADFDYKSFSPFWSWKVRVERCIRGFDCFKKSVLFRKKRGFASKHVNMMVILSFSVDWLETLKRYIDIFKKRLFLI